MLHDELRSARERAKLSQTDLAILAGIPRNQVARAERGENITLDTLRKIVVHLPIHVLPLIEKVDLTVDIFPEPEKVFFTTVETVQHLAVAMGTAIQAAMDARWAVEMARRVTPLPTADGVHLADVDPGLLLRRLEQTVKELEEKARAETA